MRRREFLGKSLIGTAGMTLGASGLLITSCKGANDKVVLALGDEHVEMMLSLKAAGADPCEVIRDQYVEFKQKV